MKTPLKYLIAFISLILFLILLAWLFLNYIQPATPVDQLPGKLPSLLKKLAPKLEPANENQTPFGSALDIPELVIDDPELKTGQAKLAEIGQTVTQLQTKVDSQKKVLAGYISYGESMRAKGYTKFETKIPNTLSNSAVGSADSTTPVYTGTNNPNTNTDYNQNTNSYTDPVAYNTSTSSFTNPVEYNRVVTELRNQISYYERIIYTYTTMIERFSGAIAYTYCNGYTVPKPGDVVDVTQLQYGLLLIHRSDGTTTNVPCAWKGVTTFIPIDSPFHPRNLFRNLPKWLEQYQNINLGYTDRNSWSNFDSQIRWQGNPPSVWYYYLNVFFSIYATFTVDIITDLSRLWTQFETVYPLTDWQRYQNVNVWLSSYESYFNNGHLHLEGIMQTNDAMSSICMNIRLGTRGFTRAQLDPNRIAYLFDGFDPTSISLQPLLIDEHDINGQNRQQVECTSTTAGQWKSFSYDRTDLNPNQVYLFDIIDRDFKWYDINQNTNTIELRSFRYYGPRTTDSLDTHNPVVSLIQRMDITQDQVVATGLPPGLYSSLYTQKTPRTTTSRERGSASIALLIDSQNDARALRSYRVPLTLSYTQTDRSGQITTKTANSPTNYSGYPSLPLITGANYFEVPIGTGTNYFRPFIVYFDASNFYPIDPEDTFTVENAVTGDILLPPTKFSSLNAFVNANLICGVGDGVDGGCFKIREIECPKNATPAEKVRLGCTFDPVVRDCPANLTQVEKEKLNCFEDKQKSLFQINDVWADVWYYFASLNPLTRSSYYATQSLCLATARAANIANPICYNEKIRNVQVWLLSEFARDVEGKKIGSIYTNDSAELKFMVKPNGKTFTAGLLYGRENDITKMSKLSQTQYIDGTSANALKYIQFKLSGLTKDITYYYVLYDTKDPAAKLSDVYQLYSASFTTGVSNVALSLEKLTDLGSIGNVFNIDNLGTGSLSTGSGLVPCGYDRNNNKTIDAADKKRLMVERDTTGNAVLDATTKQEKPILDAKGNQQYEYFDSNRDGITDPDGELCNFNHIIKLLSNLSELGFKMLLPAFIIIRMMMLGGQLIMGANNSGCISCFHP